jgi:hypothetical protein
MGKCLLFYLKMNKIMKIQNETNFRQLKSNINFSDMWRNIDSGSLKRVVEYIYLSTDSGSFGSTSNCG